MSMLALPFFYFDVAANARVEVMLGKCLVSMTRRLKY